MSVLDRSALVDSPLADLHAIASELSIDGFRRLRRTELIDAILAKQGGETAAADGDGDGGADGEETSTRSRRGRRGGRGRSRTAARDDEPEADAEAATEVVADAADEEDAPKPRRSRSRSRAKPTEEEPEAEAAGAAKVDEEERKPSRPRRSRAKASEVEPEAATAPSGAGSGSGSDDGDTDDEVVQGVVELLANGSGFVRVAGPDPSDDDVYISSAQVKRCELVSGDTITGPKRAPRRSERFASLIRVETVNGRPASELADGVRFDDLPATLPTERLKVGSEDPTLKAIEWLTPFGRGSRVTITGASRAGKTEALKRLAAAFANHEELTVTVVLAGVRPEEITAWSAADAGPAPVAAVSFAASEDVQNGTVEPVIDQARRLAARGAHALVLIDTLDGLSPQAARRVMASARNIVDGGSVTVVATASAPIGGETTVIALDVSLTSVGRFPALDLVASGTLRPELLVGEAGADAIARTRAEVSEDGED
jgi:transcription termination factor Rho